MCKHYVRWHLILNEKCGGCVNKNYFSVMKNTAGYYEGPVKPSIADVSPVKASDSGPVKEDQAV